MPRSAARRPNRLKAERQVITPNRCVNDRDNGFDIADYIIAELLSKKSIPVIQSCFSPTLQSMIDRNKALIILINGLLLEEIKN